MTGCCCRVHTDGWHCRMCHDHNGTPLPAGEPASERRSGDDRRAEAAAAGASRIAALEGALRRVLDENDRRHAGENNALSRAMDAARALLDSGDGAPHA